MSIGIGQAVFASDIVARNSEPTYSGTLPDSADWIQDSIGNDGMFYSHRASGQPLFHAIFKNGMFGGGELRIRKWVNDGWNETISDWNFGWNVNENLTWNSTGPGLYRVYSNTAFQFSAIPWEIWCGQNTGISRGDQIILWDDFRSSLNQVGTGTTKITASLANSQRMGA